MARRRRTVDPIRSTRMRSDAKMTRTQVMAAHKLYKAGMTIDQIADGAWKSLGYKNQKNCSRAIHAFFLSFKLKTRNHGEARWLHVERKCKTCGCHHDLEQPGCGTCRDRHNFRRRKARREAAELIKTRKSLKLCTLCGCETEEYSFDCAACDERRRGRERRSKLVEARGHRQPRPG